MKEINWKRIYGVLFKYGGLSTIILSGIALFHRWLVLGVLTQKDYLEISPAFSIGIALFALGLSFESTDRMKSIVNVKFGEVKGAIEDRRLELREQRGKIEQKKKKKKDTFDDELDFLFIHSFGIWKCYTFLEQALELKDWLERADQKQLIDHICMFFDELRYGGMPLSKENLHHIDMIYNSVSQLDRLKRDKELEKKLKTAYDALKSNKK